MTRWEYKSVIYEHDNQLNTLGGGGWELISIRPMKDLETGETNEVCFLKRPLEIPNGMEGYYDAAAG